MENLFTKDSFEKSFKCWSAQIEKLAPAHTTRERLDLGDHLHEIFNQTAPPEGEEKRSQSSVSKGGKNWEALVCWYLNICTVGRNTVVVPPIKDLLPQPILDAVTIQIGAFSFSQEPDLVALSFPNLSEYQIDKEEICINDTHGKRVLTTSQQEKYPLMSVMNALVARDFGEIGVHIIQCKTNWKDNAQAPMLWDAVYHMKNNTDSPLNLTVGKNNYSVQHAKANTYSFVTVPTGNMNDLKPTSAPVVRLSHLSGCVYWGNKSQEGIASSIKEMLDSTLSDGSDRSTIDTMDEILQPSLSTTYKYFQFPA